MLDLLSTPGKLNAAVVPGLMVGTVLMLVGRPISVAASVTWFKVPWRHQGFLSWAGLRGAVPIVLATIPLSLNGPGATKLFDVVFVLVVIYTILQGGTIAPAARWLGVSAPAE